MKLVFDLDGVLRDLNLYLQDRYGVPYPQEWFWKYKNRDIFEWIELGRYEALVYSPATKYVVTVCKNIEGLELWTAQPDKWKTRTKLWINATLGDCTIHYLTASASSGDFTLPASSPLIGAGFPQSMPGATGDYNWNIGVDQGDHVTAGGGGGGRGARFINN